MHCFLLSVLYFITTIFSAQAAEPLSPIAYLHTVKYVCVDMPPYMMMDSPGNFSGLLVDIFNKTAKKAGIHMVELAMEPATRMIESMKSGDAHVWNGIVLPAMKEHVYTGKIAIGTITLASFQLGKHPPIKEKKDLKGKRVIIIRGFGYGGMLNYIHDKSNGVIAIEAPSHDSAFAMLKANRADYLLNYVEASSEKNTHGVKVTLMSTLYSYFSVSKKAPNARILLEKLEVAYQQLVRDKELPLVTQPLIKQRKYP